LDNLAQSSVFDDKFHCLLMATKIGVAGANFSGDQIQTLVRRRELRQIGEKRT
jgi:hypothetical protein